jgi:DNA-binding NtrC family response regulator
VVSSTLRFELSIQEPSGILFMTDKPKHSLLLVDDEPEILFSLQGLLRREFNLHTASSAEEALQILNQHPIHIVMTDQRMPEITGVELMKRVRSEYPSAIRIVFTGYADIKAVIDAINHGGLYRYLTKPWDPDELIDVLHAAAGEYDRTVERAKLRRDLRTAVREIQALLEGLSGAAAETQVHAISQLAERLGDLADRLEP